MLNERLNWTPVIKSLGKQLQKEGFNFLSVDDGGECIKVTTIAEMEEVVTSVDESWIVVEKDGIGMMVFIILGNEPEETVNDCSYRDDDVGKALERACDTFSRIWEGQPCPRIVEVDGKWIDKIKYYEEL